MTSKRPTLDRIYHADALKLLHEWPAGFADALVTDPPFGNNIGYGKNRTRIIGDEDPTAGLRGISASYRVLKNDAIGFVFCAAHHLAMYEFYLLRYTNFKVKEILTWSKGSAGFGYTFRRSFENVLCITKGNPSFRSLATPTVLTYSRATGQPHPHAKPVALLEQLINLCTDPGGVVLDPFAGSGSTLVAAAHLGRRFLGIEIDAHYAQVAERRIASNEKRAA